MRSRIGTRISIKVKSRYWIRNKVTRNHSPAYPLVSYGYMVGMVVRCLMNKIASSCLPADRFIKRGFSVQVPPSKPEIKCKLCSLPAQPEDSELKVRIVCTGICQPVFRIRDPVPFWPLDPGSGIGFLPDPGSRIPNPYIWEHIENFLGRIFNNSSKIGPNFFL